VSTTPLHTLAIVGVGLIGGSIGLAAKSRGLASRVLGVGRQRASLDEALAVAAIDEAFLEIVPAVRQADLTVFCTPVDHIVAQVLEAAPHCRPGAILTDAGSTKSAIVRGLEGKLPPGIAFVGSHPLAGSEKRGPKFADARLFEGRVAIVTHTEQTDAAALQRVADFWQALGSRVKRMNPEAHDRALALTSHLPHLLASALAGILPAELAELAATGFRDTTRIAAGDPALWTGIFEQNRSALLDALSLLANRLVDFRQAIERQDHKALDRLLIEAKHSRDRLS
jgi:prephenate dehydrogenase